MRINIYKFNLLSSPYLLVFSDDRVRGTREQRILMQVVLVELSCREGIAQEFYLFIISCFATALDELAQCISCFSVEEIHSKPFTYTRIK